MNRPTPIPAPKVDLDAAKAWLQEKLSRERLSHSLGAHDKALELARKFRLPAEAQEKAAVAGLLHDAAKLMGPRELFDYCDRHGLAISEADRESPQTLHPFVGADLVMRELGIEDPEILDAIRYHTTGRAGMDRVEQIVYIADKIEENTRNPLFVKRVAAHLDERNPASLDETMLYLLDSTIAFVMEKRQVIHPRTLEARNDFIRRLKQTTGRRKNEEEN